MEYVLYALSGMIGGIAAAIIVRPERSKRIIYNLAYLLPFWSWGIISLIISVLVWNYRWEASVFFIIYTTSLLFFVKGLIFLFLPKRKIKKALEWFLSLGNKKTKHFAIILAIIASLIFIGI